MKTQVNSTDYNVFVDENGNITAELKRKSLRLSDIIRAQEGQSVYFIYDDKIFSRVSSPELTDQIKASTARKAMLYGQILRIADYANGDWERKKNEAGFYNIIKDTTENRVSAENTFTKSSEIYFESKELAQQAYKDNKELFDEFLSL